MFYHLSIFFVETNVNLSHFSPVSLCSYEAAAVHNPDHDVLVLIPDDVATQTPTLPTFLSRWGFSPTVYSCQQMKCNLLSIQLYTVYDHMHLCWPLVSSRRKIWFQFEKSPCFEGQMGWRFIGSSVPWFLAEGKSQQIAVRLGKHFQHVKTSPSFQVWFSFSSFFDF